MPSAVALHLENTTVPTVTVGTMEDILEIQQHNCLPFPPVSRCRFHLFPFWSHLLRLHVHATRSIQKNTHTITPHSFADCSLPSRASLHVFAHLPPTSTCTLGRAPLSPFWRRIGPTEARCHPCPSARAPARPRLRRIVCAELTRCLIRIGSRSFGEAKVPQPEVR